MIDTTSWKVNDPEWKAKRDADWPVFEWWLQEQYSLSEDRPSKESMESSKVFYDTGVLDFPRELGFKNMGLYEALALHPSLNEFSVREVINFGCYSGSSFKGSFGYHYWAKRIYIKLIEQGVLPKDFILTLLKGFYGSSLAEAAEILEFEPKDKAFHIVSDLGSKLFVFFANGENEYITADVANYMLPFYLDALPYLTESDLENCEHVFRMKIKRKTKYFDTDEIADPVRRQFMEKILHGIKSQWDRLNPSIQQMMRPLIS